MHKAAIANVAAGTDVKSYARVWSDKGIRFVQFEYILRPECISARVETTIKKNGSKSKTKLDHLTHCVAWRFPGVAWRFRCSRLMQMVPF